MHLSKTYLMALLGSLVCLGNCGKGPQLGGMGGMGGQPGAGGKGGASESGAGGSSGGSAGSSSAGGVMGSAGGASGGSAGGSPGSGGLAGSSGVGGSAAGGAGGSLALSCDNLPSCVATFFGLYKSCALPASTTCIQDLTESGEQLNIKTCYSNGDYDLQTTIIDIPSNSQTSSAQIFRNGTVCLMLTSSDDAPDYVRHIAYQSPSGIGVAIEAWTPAPVGTRVVVCGGQSYDVTSLPCGPGSIDDPNIQCVSGTCP